MERITISVDEKLAKELDAIVRERGPEARHGGGCIRLERRRDERAVAHRDADDGDHAGARDGHPAAPSSRRADRPDAVARVEKRQADRRQRESEPDAERDYK